MMSRTTRWREAEQPLGVSGRESGKAFPARIDVDDSIERDDLRRTDQVGQVDKVALQIGDATVVAAAPALLARRVELGSGGVDTGRAGSTGVEELMQDGADPTSDIQERCAFDPSAISASFSVRVEGMGPCSRYLRSSEVARFSS
jgi:hypothetical protein